MGKAIPYGIYDVGREEGWVSISISAETAQFAVASIQAWWEDLGQHRYPNRKTVTITADCGGSNSYRVRLWKTEIAAAGGCHLSADPRAALTARHIEAEQDRASAVLIHPDQLARQAAGQPPSSNRSDRLHNDHTGLKVDSRLGPNAYDTKIQVSEAEMRAVNIERDEFHPEWNYTIIPTVNQTRLVTLHVRPQSTIYLLATI